MRLTRGVYDIAHQTRIRTLLKNRTRPCKGAVRVSFLPADFLFDNIQNTDVNDAGSVSDLTAAVSRDGYTRVKPVVLAVDTANERELGKYCNPIRTWPTSNVLVTHRGRIKSRNWINFVFSRAYSDNGSITEPLYKNKTAYYEILGVMGSATQAQIKTAYYKQSFMYHPDRNAGSDEATGRFSEISEAYSVLGNIALRKKYDRGLLSSSDLIATAGPSAKDTTRASSTKLYTNTKRSVVGGSGRVFDFDKFFKAHYSEQLQREREFRVRKAEVLKKKEESVADQKLGNMMEVGVGVMVMMAMVIILSLKRD